MIESQLRLGFVPSLIASGLGRSRSTVLREMHRNGWERQQRSGRGGRLRAGGYRADEVDRRARRMKRVRRRQPKLVPGTPLWEQVATMLMTGLSPAQVALTLKRMASRCS